MLIKFAVKEFIDDRKFKNLSKQTITAYTNTLNQFCNYSIENEVVNIEDTTSSHVKSYLMQFQEQGNKPGAINHKMRNLKVFYQHLINEDILPDKQNPMRKINYLKEDIEIGAFTQTQITQMLNYYRRLNRREKTYFCVRDYCLIITLLGTGARLGEICNLQWKDVDFDNAKLTIIGKKRVARTIPMTEKLILELKELKLFKERHFEKTEELYVFTNVYNKKITETAIQNIFKRLKDVMNFRDVRLSAHTFRHTFAKNWIMAGGDIFSLQKILGHCKLEMTQKYVTLFGSEVKIQNDKFNPLNNLNLE
jgi:integrase/recombinase XerD